jgi:hypothetical protein
MKTNMETCAAWPKSVSDLVRRSAYLGLWDMKGSKIPRLSSVCRGHFSTRCVKLPSSAMVKALIRLVKRDGDILPVYEYFSRRSIHRIIEMGRTRGRTVFWSWGTPAGRTLYRDVEYRSMVSLACGGIISSAVPEGAVPAPATYWLRYERQACR